MIYNFEKEIVNKKDVMHFYDKNNFVGYILPDGSIYKCKNHNVSNVDTVLTMFLMILKDNYADKEKILSIETSDKLLQIIIRFLKKASNEKIVALLQFIKDNNLVVSDLIVSLFGCHLITRLDRTILTSETNHTLFFNYLLNDFTIHTIDKIIYDSVKKEYKYFKQNDRNDYLYDEVKYIKESVCNDDIALFYKTR